MTALDAWFDSAPGQYLLAWERAQLDAALADVFGYHALQLGLPGVDTLAANRMPHRWRAALTAQPSPQADLVLDSVALPFAQASLDLVVLPHTLEFSANAHASLREVHRVLVHEGCVAITGFNPCSLWGLRQMRAGLAPGRRPAFLPEGAQPITPWRLRDWLRLLEFEVSDIHHGCWRPAWRSPGRLARSAWLENLGARWWPALGAAYCLTAIKRSPGARLIGTGWRATQLPASAVAGVAQRSPIHPPKDPT